MKSKPSGTIVVVSAVAAPTQLLIAIGDPGGL